MRRGRRCKKPCGRTWGDQKVRRTPTKRNIIVERWTGDGGQGKEAGTWDHPRDSAAMPPSLWQGRRRRFPFFRSTPSLRGLRRRQFFRGGCFGRSGRRQYFSGGLGRRIFRQNINFRCISTLSRSTRHTIARLHSFCPSSLLPARARVCVCVWGWACVRACVRVCVCVCVSVRV